MLGMEEITLDKAVIVAAVQKYLREAMFPGEHRQFVVTDVDKTRTYGDQFTVKFGRATKPETPEVA